MAVLIFKLNGVSEEEAEDVRQLLEEHDLDFYESSAGRWGVSVAGLWLKDNEQKPHARQLIDAYQQQRVARLRVEGQLQEGMWQRFKSAPAAFIAMIFLVVVVAYVSIAPFVGAL